jgi:arsenate reductase-like glutaredoxin family protein
MFSDHLKTCDYCRNKKDSLTQHKPTITIKSASSYSKQKKLSELGAIIKGISYPSLESMFQTKGASIVRNNDNPRPRKPGPIEREVKLKELGKMIKGL